MVKPIIGVTPLYDSENERYWMRPGYMKGIEAAGGIPFMLPMTADKEVINEIATQLDGFLFTRGHDINPELYGEEAEEVCGELCSARDELEAALFKQVLQLDKPMFGICRGMQLFNVMLGGTLYQDLPTQYKSEISVRHRQAPPFSEPAHDIYIEKESPLHRMFGTDTVKVNSYHHQGIKKLAEPLVPAARAEDGVIEAVVMPGKKYVLAVQWHPEYTFDSEICNFRLFEHFVNACRK